MVNFYLFLERRWFLLPQKLRYLLVGGGNTIFAYVLFAILYFLTKNYSLSLVIQYIFSVNVSIFDMRYYVFQKKGSLKKDYMRAIIVYLSMLYFNWVSLWVLCDILGVYPLCAQIAYIFLATILTFTLLKYFSFKK